MEALSQPTSFLDDFRKCIEEFEDGDKSSPGLEGSSTPVNSANAMDGGGTQLQKQILLSALSASSSVKSEDMESYHQENRKRLDESLGQGDSALTSASQEQLNTTRYNIITGGIYQQNNETAPAAEDHQMGGFDESAGMENPVSPVNLSKGYSCRVCSKSFVSRSGLRKHICRQEEDEAASLNEINGYAEGKVQESASMAPIDIRIKTEPDDGELAMVEGIKHSPLIQTQRKDLAAASDMQYPPVEAMDTTAQTGGTDEQGIDNIDIKTEPGQLFMCPICSMTFTQASVLTRHYRAHSNERPHECKDCHKAFRRKCHLKRHWQRIHSGEKPFKCGICSKAFSDRDHQRQHETIHGPETYPCLRCRSVYPTEKYLAAHVGEHPDCKAAFAASADNQIKRMRTTKGTKGMPGSYRCGLCGDYFKKLRQIQTHQRVRHHDAFEKKYKCNICQKGFDLISDLTHHRSSHVLRGSKYDLDRDTKGGAGSSKRGRKMDASAESHGENKAELMQMLQQLERRIQMQERRVQQMEHRQENLVEDEWVDGSEFDDTDDDLGNKLRYMLENGGGISGRGTRTEGTFDEGYTQLLGANHSLGGGESNGLEGATNGYPDGVNGMGAQTKAVLDLMFKNRHKCKECGLSFLLYSEFRDHRKRHERARAAFGIEGEGSGGGGGGGTSGTTEVEGEQKSTPQQMIGGNPEGDRNLCRDCCNENEPGHVHSHGTEQQSGNVEAAQASSAPAEGETTGSKIHTRSKSKSSSKDSPYVSVLRKSESCTRCKTYLEELQQEREDRMLLQDEVEGLRDVLIQFASFASRYPSLDNQLLTLLQRNHSRLSKTLPSPEQSPE